MYMVNQRVTTAVRDGYRVVEPDVLADQLAEARRALAWLEGMQIDSAVRASLVEPIAAVEEALSEVARVSARS
jgi:hypothetical protein